MLFGHLAFGFIYYYKTYFTLVHNQSSQAINHCTYFTKFQYCESGYCIFENLIVVLLHILQFLLKCSL